MYAKTLALFSVMAATGLAAPAPMSPRNDVQYQATWYDVVSVLLLLWCHIIPPAQPLRNHFADAIPRAPTPVRVPTTTPATTSSP